MRLLKKFNQYMLEHHPLTWHSKFIQLLAAGLLFWLISYICGYLMVNIGVIKYSSLERYYSGSNFVSFHVIYCLVVICLWAIFFYKNNAVKSFYPLQRFYLVRLFLQLFVAFALLVSADIPFTAGCYAKTRALLPESEMERDIEKLNRGAAFLAENQQDYYFAHRDDIRALNYERISYDHAKGKWNESFDYYYYPEMLDSTYIRKTPAYRNFVSANDSNVTDLDGSWYLFFSTATKYTDSDSCSSITLIKEFYDLNKIQNLHEYAVANYNSKMYDYLDPANGKKFWRTEIPKIHRWAETDQKDSVKQAIQGLIDVCIKYKIDHDLDPDLVATCLQAKNYTHISRLTRNYVSVDKLTFARNYPEDYAVLLKYADGKALEPADSTMFVEAMENQEYLFYESSVVGQIISSYGTAYEAHVFRGAVGFLFLAFFLAWLFIFFEFANIISLLISIPVAGVISILVAIVLVYINIFIYAGNRNYGESDYHQTEKMSMAVVFCVCLLIFLTTLFGLFRKRFNKKILNVLINMSYMLAPVLISLFAGLVNIFSGHTEYSKCSSTSYEYSYTQLLRPELMLLYAFIGICCYFPLIVKWRAREE